jgi:hypothetical protein
VTDKVFGFSGARLPSNSRDNQGDLGVPEIPLAPRLYAFTTSPRGGAARCFDFSDDPEGHRALISHLRTENVVRVVRGAAVNLERYDALCVGSHSGVPVDFQPISTQHPQIGNLLHGEVKPESNGNPSV